MYEPAPKIDIIKDAQHLIMLAHKESWSQNYIPVFRGKPLEEEGGTTDVSRNNLKKICDKIGVPVCAEAVGDGNVLFYFALPDDKLAIPPVYLATGFTFSYNGTGPNGLATFIHESFSHKNFEQVKSFIVNLPKEFRGILYRWDETE